MKVSIIVPVYNVEKFIHKCIESIINQTFSDWEAILVDDGSTDNSGVICDEYAKNDCRITVIHKVNEGLSNARKSGVQIAKGEFIYHLDSDDFIANNTIELLINKQQETDADIVKGSYLKCDINGNPIINGESIAPNKTLSKEDWLKFIIVNSHWNVCNNIFRTKIYREFINVPANVVIGEDCIASLQIAPYVKKISTISDITYFYTQRGSSIMGLSQKEKEIKSQRYIPMLNEIDKAIEVYKKEKIDNSIITLLGFTLINILIRDVICSPKILDENKNHLYYLYKKYYINNRNVRLKVFKRSPRRYIKYWMLAKLFK